MKFLEIWRGITDSISTQGGSLLLLTVILFAFFPLLLRSDPEGWKAATFILGAITGLINATARQVGKDNQDKPKSDTPDKKQMLNE